MSTCTLILGFFAAAAARASSVMESFQDVSRALRLMLCVGVGDVVGCGSGGNSEDTGMHMKYMNYN